MAATAPQLAIVAVLLAAPAGLGAKAGGAGVASTGAAMSPTVVEIGVLGVVGVPLGAVGLRTLKRAGQPSANILFPGYDIKVCRVHAATIAAEVVQRLAFGNRTYEELVGEPVRSYNAPAPSDAPVAANLGGGPVPAPIPVAGYFLPKARWQSDIVEHA